MKTSARTKLFIFYVTKLYGTPLDVLMKILGAPCKFSALYRCAALRILVSKAPLSITLGTPYLERRRRVRVAYKV